MSSQPSTKPHRIPSSTRIAVVSSEPKAEPGDDRASPVLIRASRETLAGQEQESTVPKKRGGQDPGPRQEVLNLAETEPIVLTAKGAANFLKMPLRSLRYRISIGDAPQCYKVGSQYRFLQSELLDWLRSHPVSVPGVRED